MRESETLIKKKRGQKKQSTQSREGVGDKDRDERQGEKERDKGKRYGWRESVCVKDKEKIDKL